ncbi:MAG: ComEC/Rec2 family competence protein [Bacteroidales bacterium]
MIQLSEKIRSVPSFRAFLGILLGILFEYSHTANIQLSLLLALVVLLCLCLSLVLYTRFIKKAFRLVNFLIIPGFFLVGILLSATHRTDQSYPGKGLFLAKSVSLPAKKTSTVLVKLKLINEIGDKNYYSRDYFIYAYFPDDSKKEYPKPGEFLLLNTELKQNSNSGNPSEFDYAAYLNRNKIYSTIYLPDSCWMRSNITPTLPFYLEVSLNIKRLLQDKIKKAALSSTAKNYQVMLAICTGDKSELDREIKTQYSQAGAIHVMAVSGLHVGMIWMFLNYLTFFLKKNRTGRILQFILAICILWLFALITGMSASVVRSCMMFSLASIARLIRKNVSIFNSLSVSALIQMVINPTIIHDVGFQFSYAAVLSILMFFPLFEKILTSKYYIVQKILALVFVSLSAQVLTFPLTIYYFHQFPLYFLLTNICIIPLVTLVMTSYLTATLFLPFPVINHFFLMISLFLINIMNICISKINSLPFNLIEDIHLTHYQAITLLIVPLLLIHFKYYKKFKSLFCAVILFILVLQAGIYNYHTRKKSQLCVFNIRGMTAIDITLGHSHYFICNDTTDRIQDIHFAAAGYWHEYYRDDPEYFLLDSNVNIPPGFFKLPGNKNYLGLLSDKKIAIINDPNTFDYRVPGMKKEVDVLIMGGNKFANWKQMLNIFDPYYLIWDSSVPFYYNLKEIPDSIFIRFHRVSEKGAFVLEL